MTGLRLTPETYRAAAELLDAALDSPQPLAFLDSASAPAPVLAEARRLLALHQSAGHDFLNSSIARARAVWQSHHLPVDAVIAARYRVLRLLGEGGMGEVYLVHDDELSQVVALKTLRAHLAADPVALERFRREVLLLREIHHPNVIRILDFGRDQDLYFYTMEFLEGETLAARLKSHGPLAAPAAAALLEDLLSALSAIHTQGILHRDLKPSNIFLCSSPARAVLMDFGIATAQGHSTLTDANSVLGSLDYMSPEQLEGQELSPRSDYYSLGLVLHEALTGTLAYSGTSPVARAFRRLHDPYRPPPLPGPLARVIAACLAKDPNARPATPPAIRALVAARRLPLAFPHRLLLAATLLLALVLGLWFFAPRPRTVNPALGQHLKLAAQFASRRTAADLANARQEFQAALRLDPQNAEAWIGLAEVHSTIANFGFGEPKSTLAQANAAALRARELAPTSGAAQAVQAYIVSLDLSQWRNADPLFRRAVDLDPNQPRTRLWYGAYLTKLGRFPDALAHLQAGLMLDPASLSLHHQIVTTHLCARQSPEAIRAAASLTRLHPREPSAHLAHCAALLHAQRLREAEASCLEASRQDPGPTPQAVLASVYASQGRFDLARRLALHVERATLNVSILVDLWSRLGQHAKAIDLVHQSFQRGDSTLQYLAVSPRFDGVRSRPALAPVLQSLGFAPVANPR